MYILYENLPAGQTATLGNVSQNILYRGCILKLVGRGDSQCLFLIRRSANYLFYVRYNF